MNLDKLDKFLRNNKQPNFRRDQIIKAIYQDGVSSFLEISNIPRVLRDELEKEFSVIPFSAEKVLSSTDKKSLKALIGLSDGHQIETVLMSLKPEVWTACLSSQVGCPMSCAFCATGQMGFVRNLTSEEIYGQVLFWKHLMRHNKMTGRLANVVFMGMGEPFLNWPEVKKSLKVLMDKDFFGFGSRSISISTVGIAEGLKKLAVEFPQINLAISLHFVDPEIRKKFMPAENYFNLEKLVEALENYFISSNRKVFLEYILFKGINDTAEDAYDLVKFIKRFKKSHLLHVNLIRFNETGCPFKHSPYFQVQEFKSILEKNGINVTQRKSLGEDIRGACGQLAGNQKV